MAISLKKTFKGPNLKKKPDLKKKGKNSQGQSRGQQQKQKDGDAASYQKQLRAMQSAIKNKVQSEELKLKIEQLFERWHIRVVLRQEFGPHLADRPIFIREFQQGYPLAVRSHQFLTKEERARLPVVKQISKLTLRAQGAQDFEEEENRAKKKAKTKTKT